MGGAGAIIYFIDALAVPLVVSAAVVLVGSVVERLSPIQRQSWSTIRLNLAYLFPYAGLHVLLGPSVTTASVWFVNALGGGFFVLPSTGWAFAAGLVLFTLTTDFAESAFHLAQHKISFLWKLHALHHSDTQVNISTTNRHCWVELLLKTVTIYACVGLLFKANAEILAAYNVIAFWNYFSHMNIRVGFGRFSWLINSPQYHRLHHSSRPQDFNLRYAAIFPIFDVVCGTYRMPERDEYVETGLDNDLKPSGILGMILWPFRPN